MLEEREETRYDVRAFAQAHVDGDEDSESGFLLGHESYSAATKVHYQQVLAGLQDLYGFTWDSPDPGLPVAHHAFHMLFKSFTRSYHRTVQPVARYGEAGLLIRQLQKAGQWESFKAASDRIEQSRKQSAEAHLDILTGLLTAALGERSAKVFTSADLLAIGIDDTPPKLTDHMHDAWEDY
jgi:hypothetical protein